MGAGADKAAGDSGGQTTGHSAQGAQGAQLGQRFDLMSLIGGNQQQPQQTQFSQQPTQVKPGQRFDLASMFR